MGNHKYISSVRIKDKKIIHLRLNSGEVVSTNDVWLDMTLNNASYLIKTSNGDKPIQFHKSKMEIILPNLSELSNETNYDNIFKLEGDE